MFNTIYFNIMTMSKKLLAVLDSFKNNIHGDFNLIYNYQSYNTIYRCNNECNGNCFRSEKLHVNSHRLNRHYKIREITFSIFDLDEITRIKFYNLTQIIKYDILQLRFDPFFNFRYKKHIENVNECIKSITLKIYLYYRVTSFIFILKTKICNIGLHLPYFVPKINIIYDKLDNSNYNLILQNLDNLRIVRKNLLFREHKKYMKYIDYSLEECDINMKIFKSIEKLNRYNLFIDNMINTLLISPIQKHVYCYSNIIDIKMELIINNVHKKYDEHKNCILFDYYIGELNNENMNIM